MKILNNRGRLVQDLARPGNMTLAKVEGVALVKGLRGTGADEPPSSYQQLLLNELSRDIEKKRTAKSEIASLNTAIVLLDMTVPPGARKGDRLDVNVKLIPGSEATSIQNGYVEDAEMRQYLNADILRQGYQYGLVNGFVTLDPAQIEKNSPIAYKQGKIIGGGVVTKGRSIWLELKEDERSAGVAQRVEDVVNKRFSYTKAGYAGKKKVAEAKAGGARINLEVPDEYRENVVRYMNVVCAISFYETADELNQRIDKLANQLLVPETSEFAAVQLEAIGPGNAKVLDAIEKGLASTNDDVRFNSAITSAYFNQRQDRRLTAQVLAEFARSHTKYRPAALATLGVTMKTSFDVDAELRKLLSDSNIETRYGAFRALWTRNPTDYMIQGENMDNQFSYHCLNCGGPSYVHMTNSVRPEIVLFNPDEIYLTADVEVEANPRLTIRSDEDQIVVKKYASGSGVDEQRRVGYKVDDVVRAMVELGATYPDVVNFLTKAKVGKFMRAKNEAGEGVECPLAIDALPGYRAGNFKQLRDVEEIAMLEEAREKARREAEKPSFWAKMSPTNWFKKEEKPTEFSLEAFDQANPGEGAEFDQTEEVEEATEPTLDPEAFDNEE